jgi:hypothetical protein
MSETTDVYEKFHPEPPIKDFVDLKFQYSLFSR